MGDPRWARSLGTPSPLLGSYPAICHTSARFVKQKSVLLWLPGSQTHGVNQIYIMCDTCISGGRDGVIKIHPQTPSNRGATNG